MKKIFIALCCAFSLCLISCASKPETSDLTPSEIQNETELEQDQNESLNQNDNTSPAEEESSSDNDNTTTGEEEVFTTSSKDFPEPDFFEEPEIITLEPEEEKPVVKVSDEPVEKEEPPVLENIETKEALNDSETSDTSESETLENESSNDSSQNDVTNTEIDSDNTASSATDTIDITDDDYNSNDNNDKSALPKVITPSRSVTLKKFEYLDVTYPGTGWVYMGLTDNSKDLAYFGRKLGTKDTMFSLQARNAGTKIVHFYKNDPLTGRYLDDYLEIIILSENGSNKTHIAAPEYKLPVQKKETPVETEAVIEETNSVKSDSVETDSATEAKNNKTITEEKTNKVVTEKATEKAEEATKQTEANETETKTDEVSSETVEIPTPQNSSTLLQEAQVLYNEKEYSAALAKLNQFFEYSTDNRDEGLYLKGQILEAKSEIRDIKGAMDAYTSLTKNYPASKLWDSANKRIIYLKRFYLEVR